MVALVTGGTGFLGSAVIRALIERGEEVRALARPESDRRNVDNLPIEIIEGDLRDEVSLKRAARGCTSLYHVAADYRLWVPRPDDIYQVNIEGTRSLMRAAAEAGAERMIYTSSVATLGLNADASPAHEDTPVRYGDMVGHYKRSKYLAEKTVDKLVSDEGAPIVIVNPSTPVGPRDVKPTPTGRMIVEAASGRMPAFVDTGLNIVHVDDVAAGHLLARDRGRIGERYILGGMNLTLREILETICAAAGRRAPRVRLPHNAILPLAYLVEGVARATRTKKEPFVTVDGIKLAKKMMFFTSNKAERELGYTTRPPAEAIGEAVAWFRKHGYCP